MHLIGKRSTPTLTLTVSANQSDYNVFTAAGSPGYRCNVVLTINANIVCKGVSFAALRTAGFASGSKLTIINNGIIAGRGGTGGTGARRTPLSIDGLPGNAGGDAITLGLATTINNTNGYIKGGGGGGGGGAGILSPDETDVWGGGGGGGGGQGYDSGAGAAGDGLYQQGTAGTAGTSAGPGGGGSEYTAQIFGGTGGYHGQSGSNGGNGAVSQGGAGGASGYAVRQNGNGLTWTGGNNGAQVLGTVG